MKDEGYKNISRATHPPEPQPKQEQRCEYCDGTGDVHDQTGEWRGACVCEAGAKQEQGKPVGEVIIYTGDGMPCAPFKKVKWCDGMMPPEGTKLYTTPQQRKPLTIPELAKILASIPTVPFDGEWQLELMRAIEAAHGIKE